MEEIINVITDYRIETVIVAILTCMLTAVLKLPIKVIANKTGLKDKLTRFIVFMPMFLAFGLTVLSWFVFSRPIVINVSFITDWISATAISLAIYAVIEKMFPKKSKVMSDKNMSLIKEKITEVSDELKNGEFDDANSTENCAKLLNMILLENEKSENDN